MVYNVFSKLICILVMAEGGYDPTTENKTPWEDHGIDHDDGDDDAWGNADWDAPVDPDGTHPFEPGASSTPYHEGEAHEMANMGEEGERIPLLPQYDDFIEDRETLVNRFKAFIKAKRPKVDFSKIVVSLGKKDENKGKAVALGPKGGETVIFKQDNTFTKLKRDIKEAKTAEKEYAQTTKERNKAAKEVAKLQRKYETQRQKRDTIEADLNKTKPLDELAKEAETLKRKIEEDRRIMNDENATSRERMAAGVRFSENTDELARLDPQIQEREQELPLRERVKNIFKKYGWTLQAVALAVGIVLSALALAATNGLKAGTKALGNGLKDIGQKLGSLLPGLIGSIVSYIFKAASSVLSFLGEHAWLLILAVVTFFMEKLLKKRRR